MNEFIEECRREWERLGVPKPIANEMAADLTADLDEAEAEGASAQDVLGNSAFDPRRFAASWAVARGVTSPPAPARPALFRPRVAVVLAVLLGAIVAVSGLVLLAGHASRSVVLPVQRIVAGPGSVQKFSGVPGRFVVPSPLGPFFFGPRGVAVHSHPLISLFLVAIAAIVCAALAVALYRALWSGRGPRRRRGGSPTPGWY